mgnify:CR=1 FL=1
MEGMEAWQSAMLFSCLIAHSTDPALFFDNRITCDDNVDWQCLDEAFIGWLHPIIGQLGTELRSEANQAGF